MELSYRHRFIFIRVYRAGGESVRAALQPYADLPSPPLITRVPVLRRLDRQSHYALRERRFGHIKAKELREALPADVFGSFFKFAFVRNPWDWHVSIYHYVRQSTGHPDHARFSAFGSFEDYLRWRIDEEGPELQSEFVLSDSGELLVDFVGRHETLNQDFDTVCRRIGIDCSLPHTNRSVHDDFRRYYTPATRALVAEAYRDDIERFGYEFGDSTPRTTL